MTPPDLPARIGRYRIVRKLGQGGMAEVFLARSVGPGGVEKRLCVKRLLPASTVDPRRLERFADEARLVLGLQHAAIVPVFDFGRDGQDPFLAMEWIDGCDLGALLRHRRGAGGALPPSVAALVARELARALDYAHGRDGAAVLHLDVKPGNVLLSRQGEVRLADFGIARAVGAVGRSAGTPGYMAPEVARGEAPDARADLFSLGLVLGEMLGGTPLGARRDRAGVDAPVEIPALPEAPAVLVDLARSLVAPKPADRPASAHEVEAALDAFLARTTLDGGPSPARTLAVLVAEAAPPGAPDDEPAGGGPATVAEATVDATPVTPGAVSVHPPPPRSASTGYSGASRRWLWGALAAGLLIGGALFARFSSPPPLPSPARTLGPLPAARPGVAPAPVPAPTSPRAAAPVTPRAPSPLSAKAQKPPATLPGHLKVTAGDSWVRVFLDEKKLADNTGTFDVAPGKHTLRVENPDLHFKATDEIMVRSGETLERTYNPNQR